MERSRSTVGVPAASVMVTVLALFFVVLWTVSTPSFITLRSTMPSSKPSLSSSSSSHRHLVTARDNSDHDIIITADLVSADQLVQRLETARTTMLQQLQRDYGNDTMSSMYMVNATTTVGRTSFYAGVNDTQHAHAWDQLKNKMLGKLLQVQIIAAAELTAATTTGTPPNQPTLSSSLPPPPQWIWATGGHSSAAGHGNFFNQSYTAAMERLIAPVMASVGIHFVGRNYAMGGTSSGPEVSSCVEAIFGNDIDVLSWDFGMTDGRNIQIMMHYFYRALRLPSHPAVVAMHTSGTKYGRDQPAKMLVAMGVPAFIESDTEGNALQAMPDTLGHTDEEIASMPPYVQYARCGSQYEAGNPGCGDHKFTRNGWCDQRKYQANWHPGWRLQAVTGHLMALFLLEILVDAVHELHAIQKVMMDDGSVGFDAKAVLLRLQADENQAYEAFAAQPVPNLVRNMVEKSPAGAVGAAVIPDDIDPAVLALAPNVCHTGRLPAETRYQGILLETAPTGMHEYRDVLLQADVDRTPNATGDDLMRLVQGPDERQVCEVPLTMDFKDYFYLHYNEGQKKLVLPNARERAAYLPDQHRLKGYVAICTAGCSWGKCPAGNLQLWDYDKYHISVNGVSVTNFTKYNGDSGCGFLRHEDGHVFAPNANGQFEIVSQALHDGSYLRYSSVIVW